VENQFNMAFSKGNQELIELAGELAAAVQDFDGNPIIQRQLLQQADKLRFLLETPQDPIMRQWETVSILISSPGK
jgi:hypothetical protein